MPQIRSFFVTCQQETSDANRSCSWNQQVPNVLQVATVGLSADSSKTCGCYRRMPELQKPIQFRKDIGGMHETG